MKYFLALVTLLFVITCHQSHAQYAISGQLDTPDHPKKIYLSLLDFDEQRLMAEEQVISSTLTDSLGVFNFEGQLLSNKHGLYRIHSNLEEGTRGLDFAEKQNLKNFHNFIFSNQDTIVFKKNRRHWFSSNSNTNPVDKEWQSFQSYATQLEKELATTTNMELRQQSAFQMLSQLKSYASRQKSHPLVKLLLISNVTEKTLKQDFMTNGAFYLQLQDQLNHYYDYDSYANQYKEFITDLSKTKTRLQLETYKNFVYGLSVFCLLLIATVVYLKVQLKKAKTNDINADTLYLTNQEKRIAELIIQGKTNKDIASELFISLSTVKTHIRNLYGKLEISNREELTAKFKNHPRD